MILVLLFKIIYFYFGALYPVALVCAYATSFHFVTLANFERIKSESSSLSLFQGYFHHMDCFEIQYKYRVTFSNATKIWEF